MKTLRSHSIGYALAIYTILFTVNRSVPISGNNTPSSLSIGDIFVIGFTSVFSITQDYSRVFLDMLRNNGDSNAMNNGSTTMLNFFEWEKTLLAFVSDAFLILLFCFFIAFGVNRIKPKDEKAATTQVVFRCYAYSSIINILTTLICTRFGYCTLLHDMYFPIQLVAWGVLLYLVSQESGASLVGIMLILLPCTILWLISISFVFGALLLAGAVLGGGSDLFSIFDVLKEQMVAVEQLPAHQ